MRDIFPSLYALAIDRDDSIAYYYEELCLALAFVFGHQFLSGMPFLMMSFLLAFSNSKGLLLGESSLSSIRWDLNSNGVFNVKSYYLKLVCLHSSPIYSAFGNSIAWMFIWKFSALFKVSFVVWEASRGCIWTCDNLQKRKRSKMLVNRYFVCKENFESSLFGELYGI